MLDVGYFLSYDIVFRIFFDLLSELLILYTFLFPLLSLEIVLFYYILFFYSTPDGSSGTVSLYLLNRLYIAYYWASIYDIILFMVSLDGSWGWENVAFVLGCPSDMLYFIYALYYSNLFIINSPFH